MVVLSKIYTRTGDDGTTALGSGRRVAKYDLRVEAYGTLDEQLRALGTANQKLQEETTHLASALSTPLKVRGRWGELTLRRVAELAGMSEHCDFSEQESFSTDAGRQRPDMIVNLPGSRRIAVDAKVPLQAFIEAVDPDKPEEERKRALQRHSELVRAHLNQLAEQWLAEEADPRLHGTVKEVVAERFEREKPALKMLPKVRYDTSYRERRHVHWDGYIDVRGNRYSVPAEFCGREVTVRVGLEGMLGIYAEEGKVAGAEYRLVDMDARLPFEEESFDALMCIDSMNHFRNRPFVLSEWKRVLKT